jgi:hypothetical protein
MSQVRSVKDLSGLYSKALAERVGFEPTVRFPARSLSRRVLSTTQSPLRSGRRLHFSRPAFTHAIAVREELPIPCRAGHESPRSAPCREERLEKGSGFPVK